MCTSSPRSAPGRSRAKGPTMALAPTLAPSMWVKGWITAPAAMWASRMTQFAPTCTPSPRLTWPSKTQFTSISTSLPHSNWPRTSSRAGSARRTPASIRLSAAGTLEATLQVGELHRAVHAQHLGVAGRLGGHHRHAFRHRHGDDVGEIELALHVVVLQRHDPAFQRCCGRRHDAGVDLANGTLRLARVLVFDDAQHLAIARRAGCGHSRWRRAARSSARPASRRRRPGPAPRPCRRESAARRR